MKKITKSFEESIDFLDRILLSASLNTIQATAQHASHSLIWALHGPPRNDIWEERLAIMIFDGGLSEKEALEILQKEPMASYLID